MKKRNDILGLLCKDLLDKLTREEQQQLDEWLNASEANRKFYNRLKDGDDLMSTYEIYKRMDKKKVWHEVASMTTRRHNPFRRMLRPLMYAASVAAVLLLAVVLWNDNRSTQMPKLSPEVAQAIDRAEHSLSTGATLTIAKATPMQVTANSEVDSVMNIEDVADDTEATLVTLHDKEFWLKLPDGTRVHLNYGTSITYPLKFVGKERRVTLEGEAYFLVAQNSSQPFVVNTAMGEIRDYGTEFNVNTRGKYTSVTLVKGSVGVTNATGRERMMYPGEMAEMNATSVKMSKVDVAPLIAWNTGQFNFTDCPLENLMQVISRWYARPVVFASEHLKRVKVTGTLSRYEDEKNTLEAIELVAGVKIKAKDGNLIIEN